jgi:hypothetical protein
MNVKRKIARALRINVNRLVRHFYIRNKGKFCRDCGARGRHVLDCKYQDWEGMRREMKSYYNAWIRENDRTNKLIKEITFWQGKYSLVKCENNKLRTRLYK